MAEATGKTTGRKKKKVMDEFADDLDAMLTSDEAAAHHVGKIDDDDAIDRLLVADDFSETAADEFGDLDDMLADVPQQTVDQEIDEFADDTDDLIASVQSKDAPDETTALDLDEFADDEQSSDSVVQSIEEVEIPEVVKLEQVAEIDEFADDELVAPVDSEPTPIPPVHELFKEPEVNEENVEVMAEIDEFSDVPIEKSASAADFLMADFDISTDDLPAVRPQPAETIDDEQLISDELAETNETGDEQEPEFDLISDEATEDNESPQPVESLQEAIDPAFVEQQAQLLAVIEAHKSTLAELNKQITELKKHQSALKHELVEKAGKDEVLKSLDEIDSLQTEQKKLKRGVDAVSNQKPVLAYTAIGIAVVAMIASVGLAIEGFITKSQVGELVGMLTQVKEQVAAAPANDAADKEMMRKQLDELTVTTGVLGNQIAEISKAQQLGPAPSNGNESKTTDNGDQLMQMGGAIEAMQQKIAALEKGKATAAPAAKPVIKKPVIEENWSVNLIAFRQDWYAKRKAEEFSGKGVPAKVLRTDSKGDAWYRLYVDGFKSQYEAAAYAAKIKKMLNLESPWVTKAKE